MKDIDTFLSEQPMQPSRSLSEDFTGTVVTRLKAGPRCRRWGVLHSLRAKIGITSLGLLLVAGSAAAAVTTFTKVLPPPTPNVNQGTMTKLPNGNRIVGYNLQNCQFYSYFSGTNHVDTQANEIVYYEIKKGSKLTTEQLQTALQGECEQNIDSTDMGAAIQQLENEGQAPKYGFGGMAYIVKKITNTSITVALDPVYGHTGMYAPDFKDVTYNQYYSGLKVYNQTLPDTYSDIKPGDTVQLYMNDTLGYAGTGGIANAHPEDNPSHDIVYIIMKIPPVTASPNLLYSSIGTDVVRVTPCTTDPSGYCFAYDAPGFGTEGQ